jgi:iron complex outermembrane receptor protein
MNRFRHCLLALLTAVTANASPKPAIDFSIAAQPLSTALIELSKQAHIQVLTAGYAVEGIAASNVAGKLTVDAAVVRMLKGSGFGYRFVDEKTLILVKERAETSASGVPGQPDTHSGGDAEAQLKLVQGEGSVGAAATESASSNTKLEEIIVTAQKRSERAQDVPVPVTAISADALVDSNQLRVQDYYASVPGFSVSPTPGAGGSQTLLIRGISTGSNTNPTVGVTVDDVPYGSSTAFAGNQTPDIDPSDLARVEVLRGPQGTLYGASSMGGLLKFVTVDPSTDGISGRVQADASSVYNGDKPGYGFRGAINVPLSDILAIRASGFTRKDPGYIDNPVRHVNGINRADFHGGRISVLWKPSERFSMKLGALYQHSKGDGWNDVDVLPGLSGLQQDYIPGAGAYDRKIQAYSAIMTAKIGNADLTAVTGYNINEFSASFDLTYALAQLAQTDFGVSGVPVFTDSKNSKFTQEVRLSVPIGQRIDWLFGAFYTYEDAPFAQDIWAEDPVSGAKVGDLGHQTAPSTYAEIAAFTDLTFHVTDRFDIQAGGRESEIRQTSSGSGGGAVYGTFVNPKVHSKANAFTYLLTPRFKVSPNFMVYARFASGYRAGGPNSNPDPAVPRQYDPDKTQTYEIGAKADVLDHTLSFDASLYHIVWKGLQLNLNDLSNNTVYTTNGGRARSQGVELSVESRPLTDLRIGAWIAYSDAVLTEDFPSNGAYGISGDRLPFSSRFSGNLSLNQDFHLPGDFTGFVGGALSYVGNRVGTFVGSPLRQQYPGFAKTDFHAGVRNDSWTATVFVNNITDKRGLLGGGIGNYPPFAFSYVAPRTVGVSLSKAFH